MSCTCKQVSKTEEIPEEPATPPPNYTICNARKMDIYGEDVRIEICLKERKHKDEHEFVLAPYIFKQIIGRINEK